MLGWLNSIVNFFTGGLALIWQTVLNVIKTVESYLEGRINIVQENVNITYGDVANLAKTFEIFTSVFYQPFTQWAERAITELQNYVNTVAARLQGSINGLSAWATSQFDQLGSYIAGAILSLMKWIISAIFGPLSADIGKALAWIFNEGAYLFDVITHIDKLLTLVFAWLFANWSSLASKFGLLIVAWILANWRKTYPVIVTVLEDIIVKAF